VTDAASRTASKADISALATDAALTTHVALVISTGSTGPWTTGPEGNVTVGSITSAALAMFLTVDTGETSGVAGSVGKIAQGADSAGAGAIAYDYTVTVEGVGTPIADVHVWVTTDAAGANTVGSTRTNEFGVATFYLGEGTYYFWRSKAGYSFANPDTEVVS